MEGPTRGGNRGGQGDFKWSDVKENKYRENYLGNTVNAPVGRWQNNKDVHWYSREAKDDEATEADRRREEIRKLKEQEEEALSAALGYVPVKRGDGAGTGANNIPVKREADQQEKENRRREKELRKEERARKRAERASRREERDHDGHRSDRRSRHDRQRTEDSRSPGSRSRHSRRDDTHERRDDRDHSSRGPSPPRRPTASHDRERWSRSRSRSPRR